MKTQPMQSNRKRVFVTGATGYIGSRVIPRLLKRGHEVRALVRAKSAGRLPAGCIPVVGDALDATTFADQVRDCDTFVQLVGTPHPNPSKAEEFERVDFASVRESVRAANDASVSHFIYLSVAPAASMMRAYVDVRMRGEALAREFVGRARGRSASFLRPWYVLGPGHRWPYLVVPIYWLMEAIPQTRAKAREFGLVTIGQMVNTVVECVDDPPVGERIVSVPDIRRAAGDR